MNDSDLSYEDRLQKFNRNLGIVWPRVSWPLAIGEFCSGALTLTADVSMARPAKPTQSLRRLKINSGINDIIHMIGLQMRRQ